jgi:hypothetical protein
LFEIYFQNHQKCTIQKKENIYSIDNVMISNPEIFFQKLLEPYSILYDLVYDYVPSGIDCLRRLRIIRNKMDLFFLNQMDWMEPTTESEMDEYFPSRK